MRSAVLWWNELTLLWCEEVCNTVIVDSQSLFRSLHSCFDKGYSAVKPFTQMVFR